MIKTSKTPIDFTIYTWAVPNAYAAEGEFPFTYEVGISSTHWREGSIMVAEFDLQVTVPEGVDLLMQALETLDLKEESVQHKYNEDMKEIREQRQNLLRLSGPSTNNKDYIDHETF